MPLQNRVAPNGDIVVSSSRGLLMGNRGCLHDADKRIIRKSKVPHWITCSLEFKGIKRPLMQANQYTELFFLDEATALSAGHRPCAQCRGVQFKSFKAMWAKAFELARVGRDDIDQAINRERISASGAKVTYSESIDALPNGAIIERGDQWFLVWGHQLLRWSSVGYLDAQERPQGEPVVVLTPRSIVSTLRMGYVPEVHPSGLALIA